jgi:hypothetical protein
MIPDFPQVEAGSLLFGKKVEEFTLEEMTRIAVFYIQEMKRVRTENYEKSIAELNKHSAIRNAKIENMSFFQWLLHKF